jgi:hypothetical protein
MAWAGTCLEVSHFLFVFSDMGWIRSMKGGIELKEAVGESLVSWWRMKGDERKSYSFYAISKMT